MATGKMLMDEVQIEGTSLNALMDAYNNYINQGFCKEMLERTADPMFQKSLIIDTLIFKMAYKNLKGNESLPFTYGQAYLKAGIPKEFLR
ncbi:MAG: hypothetical protein ACRCT1_19330 [Microcoleaceae cyanobacterium]